MPLLKVSKAERKKSGNSIYIKENDATFITISPQVDGRMTILFKFNAFTLSDVESHRSPHGEDPSAVVALKRGFRRDIRFWGCLCLNDDMVLGNRLFR